MESWSGEMILCRHRPGLGAGGDRCQGPAGAPPGASAVGSFSSLSSVPWAAGAVQALGEGNGPESWGGGDTGGGSCWLRAGSAQALRTAQRGGLWPSLQPLIPCLLLSSRSITVQSGDGHVLPAIRDDWL